MHWSHGVAQCQSTYQVSLPTHVDQHMITFSSDFWQRILRRIVACPTEACLCSAKHLITCIVILWFWTINSAFLSRQ